MLKVILVALVLSFCWASLSSGVKLTPLENFDSGAVTLLSWANEDINPASWNLDSSTGDGSPLAG